MCIIPLPARQHKLSPFTWSRRAVAGDATFSPPAQPSNPPILPIRVLQALFDSLPHWWYNVQVKQEEVRR
ncbi:MAG TPA: hypothetical protein VLC95_12410, partial [Anaerolineae bacterium]|nr:hypothetical protein [Anaerolineae bacterium]